MRFPQAQTRKDELALLPEKGMMKEKKEMRMRSKSIKKITKIASFMQSKKRSKETSKKEVSSKSQSQNILSNSSPAPSSAYPLSRSRRHNLDELQIECLESQVNIFHPFFDSKNQNEPSHVDPENRDETSCIESKKEESDENANDCERLDRSVSSSSFRGVVSTTSDVQDVLANASSKERSMDDSEFISAEMIWEDPSLFFESEDLNPPEGLDSTRNEEERSTPTVNRVESGEDFLDGSDFLDYEDPEIEVALPVHGSSTHATPILVCGSSGERLAPIQESDMKQDNTSQEKKRRKASGKSPFAMLKLLRKAKQNHELGDKYETREDMGLDERHSESKDISSEKAIPSKKRTTYFPFLFGLRGGTKQSHRKGGSKKTQGGKDSDSRKDWVESHSEESNKSISVLQCQEEPQTVSPQREGTHEDSTDETSDKEQDNAPDKPIEEQIDGSKVDAEVEASSLRPTTPILNRKNLFTLFMARGGSVASRSQPEVDDRHEVLTDQESSIDSDQDDESVDDSSDDSDKRPEDWVLQDAYFAVNLAATDLLTEFGCGTCCRVSSYPNTAANVSVQRNEGSSDLETGLRDALRKMLKDRDALIQAQAQEIEQLRLKKKSINEGKSFRPLSSLRKSAYSVKSLLARKKNHQ